MTTRIARQAGVFTLQRTRDLAQLAHTVAALEAHWRSLGFGPACRDQRQPLEHAI
jgi:hypothetical protein